MFLKVLYLTLLVLLSSGVPVYSLTLEEILTLKKAGVTDKTIQLILQQEREEIFTAERLGIWTTRDGRTIRSTPASVADRDTSHQSFFRAAKTTSGRMRRRILT